jgi:hypothetical protein
MLTWFTRPWLHRYDILLVPCLVPHTLFGGASHVDVWIYIHPAWLLPWHRQPVELVKEDRGVYGQEIEDSSLYDEQLSRARVPRGRPCTIAIDLASKDCSRQLCLPTCHIIADTEN